MRFWTRSIIIELSVDYEQQRRELLHKHGIDLDDGNGLGDAGKTRRLDRKEVDRLMGGKDGEGVFTWRERNRKKVSYHCRLVCRLFSDE